MLDVFRAASWVVKLTAAGEEANRPHGLNSTLTVGKIWCFPPRYVWRKTFVFSTVLTVDQRSDAFCTLTMGTPCCTTKVEIRPCGGAQACQVCRLPPSAATTWPLSSSIQYSAPDGNFSKALRTDAACSTVAYHVPSFATLSTLPCSRRRRRNRIAFSFLSPAAPMPGTPATPTPTARTLCVKPGQYDDPCAPPRPKVV